MLLSFEHDNGFLFYQKLFLHCHFWAIWFWMEIKINTAAFQENPSTVKFPPKPGPQLNMSKFWGTLSKKIQNTTQGKVIKDRTFQSAWVILQGLWWWLTTLWHLLEGHICWRIWRLIFSVINMGSLPPLVLFSSSLSGPSQHLLRHFHHSHNGNPQKCLLSVRRKVESHLHSIKITFIAPTKPRSKPHSLPHCLRAQYLSTPCPRRTDLELYGNRIGSFLPCSSPMTCPFLSPHHASCKGLSVTWLIWELRSG